MSNNEELLSLFLSLLNKPESKNLDFKRDAYNISDENKQIDLVKDIICMANTPREDNAYIVLGVKKFADGTHTLDGLDYTKNLSHLDLSNLQSPFLNKFKIEPIPDFKIDIFLYEGKKFGIITVPLTRSGPYKVITSCGDKLKSGSHIYFRRGSTNDITRSPEEAYEIMQWFHNNHQSASLTYEANPGWENFINAVPDFNPSRKYILVASPFREENHEILSVLGKIPWTTVFDFDNLSESNGLLDAVKAELEAHRSLHRVVKKERPTLNPDGTVYWFFARGLEGREGTVEIGDFKTWRKSYAAEISEQLRNLAKVITPRAITCIIIWYEELHLQRHLDSTLRSIEEAFEDSVEFVIVTKYPGELQDISNDFNARLIDIPLNQLSSGLKVLLSKQISEVGECFLPSSSEAPIPLDVRDKTWLEEELEIVHINIGADSPNQKPEEIGSEFLRGAEITWHELSVHCDVDRDKTEKLKKRVDDELRRKRTVTVNIYHEAGAGGTTIARRILWDLHLTYPSLILIRTKPNETAERIFRLTSLTGQAVLLMIDSAQIAERQVDELYNHLRSRQIPVVLLQVLRRFRRLQEGERAFYIKTELEGRELWKFIHKFSMVKPEKRWELEQLTSSYDKKVKTAFYIGLQTFGRDFLGLERHVSSRIEKLSDIQKKILVFLALAHYYAQHSIKAQAFAHFLGIPASQSIKLEHIFASREEILDLLVEVQDGEWRTSHNFIAQEIIEQFLAPSDLQDRRIWKQRLSTLAKEFAEFCRSNSIVPSEEMLEIARRTFIYRDNLDLLGTERVASTEIRSFSKLLQDIPSQPGRLEVLLKLTQLYPEEAHFWAHLGRFYASQLRDYTLALKHIEQAIKLTEEKDHVLHHMKGMALRYQINELIANNDDLVDVVRLAKQASTSFEQVRKHSPDDEHGYISEVQLLAKVLDYAGRQYPKGLHGYLSTSGIDPFLLNAMERAEDLLEQVRRNREGRVEPSPFEADCLGKLKALYGRHEQALQVWDNLLNRRDVYYPPVRRQIIWTYLARQDRCWNKLTERELQRVKDLLESNLQEEPSNDKDLRLWVQAVRGLKSPPSLEAIIEKVGYWKANSNSLDSVYYLYVFHVLLALRGSSLARERAEYHMKECRQMVRARKNSTISFEWLGFESQTNTLVHHSELRDWNKDKQFWDHTDSLVRLEGRVSRIDQPQEGYIEITGGLSAFYVPARAGHSKGRSENQRVNFYLGFSYEGLRAWEVKNIE
jgi:tetratricopeptide (TPR) repeat protein